MYPEDLEASHDGEESRKKMRVHNSRWGMSYIPWIHGT